MTEEQIIDMLGKLTKLERAIVLRVLLEREQIKLYGRFSHVFADVMLTIARNVELTCKLEGLKGGAQ